LGLFQDSATESNPPVEEMLCAGDGVVFDEIVFDFVVQSERLFFRKHDTGLELA
jgi:hypothetical protein